MQHATKCVNLASFTLDQISFTSQAPKSPKLIKEQFPVICPQCPRCTFCFALPLIDSPAFIFGCAFWRIRIPTFALTFAFHCILTLTFCPYPCTHQGKRSKQQSVQTLSQHDSQRQLTPSSRSCRLLLLRLELLSRFASRRSHSAIICLGLATNFAHQCSQVKILHQLLEKACHKPPMKGCNIAPKSMPPKFNAFFLGPGCHALPTRRPRLRS